jgi:glycosyltransferase involved in cell wall biosynthesis
MVELAETPADASLGEYVAFSGRISTEKGIDTLLTAAAQTADVPVHLAGGGPLFDDMSARAGDNVTMRGQLKSEEMSEFYRKARFLVLPTACFEGCPLVISEAMNHGLPVVASRIGGLPELVEDGVTGFLFEPGNAAELAHKMRLLWDSPALCRQMGLAGRAKAEREFGEHAYHDRLVDIYRGAIEKVGGKANRRNATPPPATEHDLVTIGSASSESYKTYN